MKSSRRKFIQSMGAGAAGLTLGSTAISMSSCTSRTAGTNPYSWRYGAMDEDEDQIIFIGDDIAVANTAYGKVRGFIHKDIYNFLGIPYGANTTGKNRFMPPQKPDPWSDIYPAVYWPNAAPQLTDDFFSHDRYLSFTDYWHYDDISENCLGINVWTPGYNDNIKRPVLFWIHGGLFISGNSIEHPEYHGENLSRKENIVFCSLNHRLGPLGFSNFAGADGEKYAASGNVGMLDIVAALEWVRDNISNFGGDPDNVTIIGQSGGGSKVTTLTAMPSAKGLFHKAVVLSGSVRLSAQKDYSEKLGSYIIKEANLNATQIEQLQEMPWREYYALANKATSKFLQDTGVTSGSIQRTYSPVIDGVFLPQDPYYPEPTPLAAEIPMIISSTFFERSPSAFDSSLEDITLDEAKELAKTTRGYAEPSNDPPATIEAYAKSFPDKKPIEILSMVISNRKTTIELANSKAVQEAPVYLAWFGWNTPLFDGRLRAFHTMDIAFWFYNTDVQISHTGGGARPRNLSSKMSSALVQFMKTGNPNGGGLPNWPRYTVENGETMILDDECEVQNDPDREARKLL